MIEQQEYFCGQFGNGHYFPHLLSRLHLRQMTGELLLQRNGSPKKLFMEEEKIHCCNGSEPDRSRCQEQARRHILGLFGWTEGKFSFWPEVSPPSECESISFPTIDIILDGVRQIDNIALLEDSLNETRGILRHRADRGGQDLPGSFTATDSFLLSRLDGRIALRDLCRISPADRMDTLRSLYGLLCIGMVEFEGAAAPATAPADQAGSGVRFGENEKEERCQRSHLKDPGFWKSGLSTRPAGGSATGNNRLSLAQQHCRAGLEYYAGADYHSAIQLFRMAIMADGQNAEYHCHLGRTLAHNPFWNKKAMRAYLRAVELDPLNAEAHLQLGRLYLASGLQQRAVARLQRALEIDPAMEAAQLELDTLPRT